MPEHLKRARLRFWPGGVNVIYPPENAKLHARIVETGAVISEMPPGFAPLASHFPRRNRIISGLSRGIGRGRGGDRFRLTHHRAATPLNRIGRSFAVPGSPLDPRSRGANDLIRQGATLTESADDVAPVFGARPLRLRPRGVPELPLQPHMADVDLEKIRQKMIELLSPTPIEIDELIRRSGESPEGINTVLLEIGTGPASFTVLPVSAWRGFDFRRRNRHFAARSEVG